MGNWRKRAVSVMASVVSAAALMSPAVAFADGGSGSGGGGTGSGGNGKISFTYRDSYGSPTLMNVHAALSAMGLSVYNDASHPADAAANTALASALSECESRYAAKHGGDTNAGCRLVSVGAVSTDGRYTGSTGGFNTGQWASAWNTETQNKTYSYQGASYKTTTPFSDGTTTINGLVAREAAKTPGIIVVVLSSDEPPVAIPPAPPTKSVQQGTSADRMVNHTTISQKSGVGGRKLLMRDIFTPNGQKYEIVNEKVTDGGQDVTSQFSIGQSGDVRTASFKGASLPYNHTYVCEFDVVTDRPSISRIGD
ncbi:MAG: hypothetical protein L0K43_05530 [Bifidobacterium crudilactis]|nr:hypothetical protein [Bifidobacterium crudilactis]